MRGVVPFLMTIVTLCSAGGCATIGFLPDEATTTLTTPTHIEAYRVAALAAHPGYGGKLDGFGVIRTGRTSPELAADLSRAFSTAETYTDQPGHEDFAPTVGYRFYRELDSGRGQMSVDVLIGFDTDQILIVARDNEAHEVFRRLFSCDRSRGDLLELTRRAFPNDSEWRILPELRPATTQADGP